MRKGCQFVQPFYFCSMKYRRLTKEQLEELHPEFINFLATQSITVEEWSTLKNERPEVVEQELDVFSDLIWEGVLAKVEYLENISPNHIHLFKAHEKNIELIAVKAVNEYDFTTREGFDWLRNHLHEEQVELMTAAKAYTEERQLELFKLIEQGASITKGELYQWFETLIAE